MELLLKNGFVFDPINEINEPLITVPPISPAFPAAIISEYSEAPSFGFVTSIDIAPNVE